MPEELNSFWSITRREDIYNLLPRLASDLIEMTRYLVVSCMHNSHGFPLRALFGTERLDPREFKLMKQVMTASESCTVQL